jgi:predicted phosphate transport protein (TIGR00153 family)
MLARFLPQQGNFFELFGALADKIVEGATETRILVSDLSQSEVLSRKLMDIEHLGDDITHRTVALLRKVFITPFDRDDIHQLISEMDTILDLMDATAQRIYLYDIRSLPPEVHRMSEICLQLSSLVQTAVKGLAKVRNLEPILKSCVEINRLENETDLLLRSGLAKLFREQSDVQQVFKVKEVYELFEQVADRCEDVAHTVERIVLEN